MCFSAQASFAGAAVIGAAGIASLALCKRPREIPFAALPFAFGVHQALEGVTWFELDDAPGAVLTGWGVHLWVLYAWALLPTWVPVAVWLIEPEGPRRRMMVPLMAIGISLTAFMLTQAFQTGIEVRVVASNLDYVLPFSPGWLLAFPYVASTCLTPAISTQRWIRVFGIGNFIAMSAAAIIKAQAYSSLWCTFAAFLSLIILAHYLHERGERMRAGASAPVGLAGT
ncbi:MAG: DUF6629 family protein [Acidimicrobiales bacterium]